MNAFEIASTDDPRELTQAVIQIIDVLDMYQAELARVLKVQCGDIGELSNAQRCLEPESPEWEQALLFVRLYQLLFRVCWADGVKMINWMRKEQKEWGESPHTLIVDKNRLDDVVKKLETL